MCAIRARKTTRNKIVRTRKTIQKLAILAVPWWAKGTVCEMLDFFQVFSWVRRCCRWASHELIRGLNFKERSDKLRTFMANATCTASLPLWHAAIATKLTIAALARYDKLWINRRFLLATSTLTDKRFFGKPFTAGTFDSILLGRSRPKPNCFGSKQHHLCCSNIFIVPGFVSTNVTQIHTIHTHI